MKRPDIFLLKLASWPETNDTRRLVAAEPSMNHGDRAGLHADPETKATQDVLALAQPYHTTHTRSQPKYPKRTQHLMNTLQSCGTPSHLGNEHEALPDHEGAEDDHGEVEALEEELALVRPELLQLEDLLVYHFSEHFLTLLLVWYKDKEQRCEPPESEVAVVHCGSYLWRCCVRREASGEFVHVRVLRVRQHIKIYRSEKER